MLAKGSARKLGAEATVNVIDAVNNVKSDTVHIGVEVGRFPDAQRNAAFWIGREVPLTDTNGGGRLDVGDLDRRTVEHRVDVVGRAGRALKRDNRIVYRSGVDSLVSRVRQERCA